MSERETYEKKLAAELDGYEVKIQELKAKMAKAAAGAREELYARIEILEERKQDLRHNLDRLRRASTEAWAEIRKGVDQAWTDLKKSMDRALSKM
ncbi:MAG: coiled coil domain-containing protein [Proteobacteria bacterium]|nr:coiled coil domain-containing protein [Pseudomonadota bacterium]